MITEGETTANGVILRRMHESSIPVAIVMQRRALQNRWQSEVWEPLGVIANHTAGGEPSLLVEEGGIAQWLHPGFELKLFRDETEGYYLNVSSNEPRVFVMWRMEDGFAVPKFITVSYNEAGRLMDGGEQVETVEMPAEVMAWVGAYVEENYRPEVKKRRRPQSFISPKAR
jgi:Protein of unknown function (DUF3305)